MTWKKYSIGNSLRGHIEFKARSEREAWERGRQKINRMLGGARWMYLAVWEANSIRVMGRVGENISEAHLGQWRVLLTAYTDEEYQSNTSDV